MSIEKTIVKKLTMKTIGANPKVVRKMDAGALKKLAIVYGVAYGVTPGQSEIGGQLTSWNRLDGEFEAVNLETGKQFRSNACFLPGGLEATVMAVLNKEGVTFAQFAIEVSAVNDEANERNTVGFFYTAKDLTQAAGADPLSKLREISGAAVKQLQAPAVETAPPPVAEKVAAAKK